MTGRPVTLTTAVAVVVIASVAAIVSYQHAYELVTSYSETGLTARLLPFTGRRSDIGGFMVVLDVSRLNHRVPLLVT